MSNQILLLLCLLSPAVLSSQPLLQTSQGMLLGTTEKSRNGRSYSAFLGVPYGQPPVGILRFQNPLPAAKWKGIRKAKSFGSACVHRIFGRTFGKEDCLFLNVYTPFNKFQQMYSNTSSENLLPVMVYIHGGSFFFGSGNDYKANYLLDKNIVFVTVNYRLGIFGFLSTADTVASGNYGMKDQVLALKWIQKNIKFFGGDPNRVTIFGLSSGASCVHLHALSKASDGLFQQYIMKSGTALPAWSYRDSREIYQTVKNLAKFVDCPTTSTKNLVNCLRNKDTETLLFWCDIVGVFIHVAELAWVPTNEPKNEPNAFLTDNPQNLLKEMKDLPFISGVLGNEAVFITNVFYEFDPAYNIMRKFMKKLFIDDAVYIRGAKKNFPANLDKFYFNSSHHSIKKRQDLDTYTNIITDGIFFYPAMKILDEIAPRMKNPTYFYHFIYRGETSILSNLLSNKNFGAGHGGDLIFYFPLTYLVVNRTDIHFTHEDRMISKLMVDLWTSFAINGKPTSKYLNPPDLWKPYNSKNNPYFQIGEQNDNMKPSVKLTNNFLPERMNFWRENF